MFKTLFNFRPSWQKLHLMVNHKNSYQDSYCNDLLAWEIIKHIVHARVQGFDLDTQTRQEVWLRDIERYFNHLHDHDRQCSIIREISIDIGIAFRQHLPSLRSYMLPHIRRVVSLTYPANGYALIVFIDDSLAKQTP